MKRTQFMLGVFVSAVLTCTPAAADSLYRRAATGFLQFLNSPKSIVSIDVLNENSLNPDLPEIAGGALVRLEGGGYILVAPSKSLTPIKAYSLTRRFEDLPPAVAEYLRQEMEGNARAAREHEASGARRTLSMSENEARWDFLLNYEAFRRPLEYTPGTRLLSTTWNQNHPYNKFTPRIDGAPTYAGCVNTAMAQIMKYHRHPLEGKGVVAYDWNGQTLKAILFKRYNWDQMPEKLDAATPAWQADQVASLIRDIGVANHTEYGIQDSSTSIKLQSFIRNFGYSSELDSLSNSDTEAFFNSLRDEIDAERPALLSLPGHMVVADGCKSEDEDPTGRNIHLNMGWGGSHDDYYYLDSPIELEGTGHSFETSPGYLTIYFPIKPCEGADCDWTSETGAAGPPVINTSLPDRVLPGEKEAAERLYLDVRAENGEEVTVRVESSNSSAARVELDRDILTLSTGPGGMAGRITIEAEAGGETTRKSFVVMTLGQGVGYGSSFGVTGKFSDQSELYEHKVILDGPCTISGDRGYSNQAFYAAVFDVEGKRIAGWDDQTIQAEFTRGVYIIRTSLDNPETSYYYKYEPGVNEGYVLNISCPEADERVETVAGLLDIDLSGIEAGDMYDQFERAGPESHKWKDLRLVREVSEGRLNLSVQAIGSSESVGIHPTGNSNYLQADISVAGTSEMRAGASGYARLGGWFYNDTFGPGSGEAYNGREGDVFPYAGLVLESDGSLRAVAVVVRSEDAQAGRWSSLYSHTFSVPVSLDTAYTFSVEYTESAVIFTCEDETVRYELESRVYEPSSPGRLLYSKIYAGPGRGGLLDTHFDNVYSEKSGALYDDFETGVIDPDKWSDLKFERKVARGRLHMNVETLDSSRDVSIAPTSTSRYLQADISVAGTSEMRAGASGYARLGGWFYNDTFGPGSGEAYNGREGDVFPYAGLVLESDGSLRAVAVVVRSEDAQAGRWSSLYSHTFSVPVSLDTAYTFSVEYTESAVIFTCEDETVRYELESRVYEPSSPGRQLYSKIYADSGQYGLFETFYDNVQMRRMVLAYDDGTKEMNSSVESSEPGSEIAVRFTPPSYPARLESVKFFIPDYGVPGMEFGVRVYRSTPGGVPGERLEGGGIAASGNTGDEWVEVDLSSEDIVLREDDFFVGMLWNTAESGEDSQSLGTDTSPPAYGRGCFKAGESGSWSFSGHQDYDHMIRAEVRLFEEGDIDISGFVDLSDLILSLQILCCMPGSSPAYPGSGGTGAGAIGLADAIHILQKIAGQR